MWDKGRYGTEQSDADPKEKLRHGYQLLLTPSAANNTIQVTLITTTRNKTRYGRNSGVYSVDFLRGDDDFFM